MTSSPVSLPASAMNDVPGAEMAAVGEAARSVIREAKAAGVDVFGDGYCVLELTIAGRIAAMTHHTTVTRASDRELMATRMFDASPPAVFAAWTTPALLQRWWAPQSMSLALTACAVDLRAGGRYRFEFAHSGPEPLAFVGRYLEVVPGERLVWTNEESDQGAVTTVTFDDRDGSTLLTMRETYPSKQALDEAFDGTQACTPEQYAQLDALLQEQATG